MKWGSYVDTTIVMAARKGDSDLARVDDMLEAARVTIVPVSLDQGSAALAALMRFVKGRHSAGLNIADCFAYALVKTDTVPARWA